LHPDRHPERTVGRERGAKDLALVVLDLPVTAITAGDQRRFEIHGQVNSLTGSHLARQWHQILPTQ